jgi:hypothetical protein
MTSAAEHSPSAPLDSGNLFCVGRRMDGAIVILLPVPARLTADQAVNLAVWLKLLSDPGGERFNRLETEIKMS